jgi:hypothetical protein
MEARIPTKPVKVMITTDDYEIQGCLHIKVGSYQSRLSDLLNAKDVKFLPITDAVYLGVNNPEGKPSHADIMIVRIDSIKSVVPDTEAEKKATKEAQAENDYKNPNVQPKGWG